MFVGFGLLLFFSLLSIRINSKLITSRRPGASARAVSNLQRYGFMAAALTIFLGFWLKADGLRSDQQPLDKVTKTLVSECEATHASDQQGSLRALSASACERDERAIRDALSALTCVNLGSRGIRALELANQGDTAEAQRIFKEIEDQTAQEGSDANREAAEAARRGGLLALVTGGTREAMAAYAALAVGGLKK